VIGFLSLCLKMKKSCLIIGLFFYVFTSCSFKEKFENNISRQSQFLEKYKDSLESVDKSIKPLDWAQAKKLLISNNISLQRSRRRAVSVIENRENYWRTYIPGLRANVSLSQALSELDSISLDTVNLSSFLTLRVPNPLPAFSLLFLYRERNACAI